MVMPTPEPVPDAGFRRESLSVFVRGLKIAAEIGVHPHERGRAQPLVVDVELSLFPRRIDTLADTVNYERIVTRARAIAAEGHIELVEDYVDRLARACLDDPRVRRVRVRVEKPEALAGAEAAGVETVLTRG
ncbi:MAG: dihydroneopterin aldolase [Proteobacteria bacterium]|nr:dihydroneopterin aldolase [Pseudomonadota bacterium]